MVKSEHVGDETVRFDCLMLVCWLAIRDLTLLVLSYVNTFFCSEVEYSLRDTLSLTHLDTPVAIE